MLPFLKKRNMPTVVISKSDDSIDDGSSAASADEGLKQAFSDLMAAINSKDVDAGAMALKACFDMCDSYEDE